MFHVITGGSGSGKSAYAEDCIVKLHEDDKARPLYYVATMMPFGAEMETKIRRHRQMRAGKGFETIECQNNLRELAKRIARDNNRPNVLLECMSNLVANEWFACVAAMEEQDLVRQAKALCEELVKSVLELEQACENLVVVTNEVCGEGEENTLEMECYKQILSGVNCQMSAVALQATEVVYGIPVNLK